MTIANIQHGGEAKYAPACYTDRHRRWDRGSSLCRLKVTQ